MMKIITVASGKGGVGKTTISLAIAKILAKNHRVALLDADVTGANTHLNLKIREDFNVVGETITPAVAEIGEAMIKYLSIALISESYVRWKGDSAGDFVSQIIENTNWDSEFLIIDAPPGLGSDAQRALEYADVIIFVAIPAKFAEIDIKRVIEYVRVLKKPVAGIYMNFSSVECPYCHKRFKFFNHEYSTEIPLIERIPFSQEAKITLDYNKLMERINNPIVLKPKESKIAVIKRELAKRFLKKMARL